MKTYEIRDAQNRLYAFEIDNWRIGRRGVCRALASIPGTILVRKPKLLSWFREDVFCEFTLDGVLFEVEEPYGDNGRYWIGPRSQRWIPQTEMLRAAFTRF